MTLANWVREVTGVDPAAEVRGTYATRFGWLRLIYRENGLVPLVDRLMLGAGLVRTSAPQVGDVGVVPTAAGSHVGAIKVGRGWAAKVDRGLLVAPSQPLAAWTFA